MDELIPQEIREIIPKLYDTENQKDPVVYVKLFMDGWTWLILELSMDADTAFGFVVSPFCDGELGYFSLKEISELKSSLGLMPERDLQFKSQPLSKIKKER